MLHELSFFIILANLTNLGLVEASGGRETYFQKFISKNTATFDLGFFIRINNSISYKNRETVNYQNYTKFSTTGKISIKSPKFENKFIENTRIQKFKLRNQTKLQKE